MISQGFAICGLGAVTGYGWGTDKLWDGLVTGTPAASPTFGYGKNKDETAWVARVPDGGDAADGPSRFARAMRSAAREAVTDAERRSWKPGRRVGLLHAIVQNDVDVWRDFYVTREGRVPARDYLALMPSTTMSTLMQEFGFRGPAMNVGAMCSSGNAGLLTAKTWLDSGIVDDVIFVATDLSAASEHLLHFANLGVAITDIPPLQACKPFQEGSRGYIMGEASVGMVLSRNTTHPYTTVLGGAMSHDAYHVTSIDPNRIEVTRCFRDALDNAGVDAADIRYFNAHGPGTKQCDRTEAAIADELFPSQTETYSIKPLVGHCQGAAAAVELAAAALGYEHGVIPAPPRVAEGSPRLLDGPTPATNGLTIKSSIGMGGHNSVVVLSAPNT